MKKILKKIINFYNIWYGIINAILIFLCLDMFPNDTIMFIFIGLGVFDCYTWYKNIFKNLGTKRELFATVKQNMALCVYGGIGCGKTTIAEYLLNHFIPKAKQYRNTNYAGSKAVTFDHLMLKKAFEPGAGVLIDEAGAQADSYHYDKNDAPIRKRFDYLNKYYRQWYGDNSLLIYIDQCQSNMNTSLYKNIYYVIQCKGLDIKPSSLILNLIFKPICFCVSKFTGKRFNNPFSLVSIEYMEFQRLGEYADHYTVNIEDKDHKKLVGSIYEFFTGYNTYVFREFNPAKTTSPYIWGTDKDTDKAIMIDNFNFNEMKKEIKNTFSVMSRKEKENL